MSFGFGRHSGPSIPPNDTTFGYLPESTAPSQSPSLVPGSNSSPGPGFPSQRTFDAQVGARPPSLDNARPVTSSSQSYSAQIRAPFLNRGDKQNSVSRDFGGQSQKRPFSSTPQDRETSLSSKFPHFQDLERSRSPPIHYNDDFLQNPSDIVEWGGKQNPVIRDFGGQFQKRSFPSTPQDRERSLSSNFLHRENLERPRSPPIQYNEDFLRDPGDGIMKWGDKQDAVTRDFGGQIQKRPFLSTSQDRERSLSSKFSHFQNLERSRSPPVQYNEDFLRDPSNDVMERNADISSDRHDHVAKQRRKSPSISAGSHAIVHPQPSWSKYQRPVTLSQTRDAPVRSGSQNPSSQNERGISPKKTADTRNSKEWSSEGDFQRSPNDHGDVSKRPSLSPPKSRNGTSGVRMTDLQHNSRLSPSADGMNDDTYMSKPVKHSVSKRTRSPTSDDGQIIHMNPSPTEDDADREEQAKAKRLARFKTELDHVEGDRGDSIQHGRNETKGTAFKIQSDRAAVEKQKILGDIPSGSMENQDFDNEELQSSSAIVGLCTDMCPESERGERERKGDLDPYERLEGDRNQTTETLAVKKYNRTAEREAELIRPLPILQKTMDYLLGLLDQPYDDRFLRLYNFMWDRMRAIRMDLRMQHIFNDRAITMLEQMIRLHILAMHELCEFSKGEGFSEGFDAHLNIEQMNKTSVELFLLYDDHRKRGIVIPTEKEFRGYYALLKLDKHPGYKVDPSELSLDLAKMTVEIRQTLEVLFARDVARSCRTCNFIAFFRHARKATYLQACLMHAHFSKLRTKALAALHSGLQYNQGIPVTQIAKWLAMEGEDIDSLLEYHGFIIKEFEEPYMVKEGPFLNNEKDYPTRCSKLVHKKKSSTIMEDVISSRQVTVLPSEPEKELQSDKHIKNKCPAVLPTPTKSVFVSDRPMDTETVSSPIHSMQDQSVFETSRSVQVQADLGTSKDGQLLTDARQGVSVGSPKDNINAFASFQSHSLPDQPFPATSRHGSLVDAGQWSWKDSPQSFPEQQFVSPAKSTYLGEARQDSFEGRVKSSPEIVVHSELMPIQPEVVSANILKVMSPSSKADTSIISPLEDDVSMSVIPVEESNDVQQKLDDIDDNYDEEVAEAKLRLLLRLWRRRFVRKKHLREQNRLAANAALSSLSLGPPIWQNHDKYTPCQTFNIDQAMYKRYEKHQLSLARWNVSDLAASKLDEKHENLNCLCWKIVSFSWSQHGRSDMESRTPISHFSLDEWIRYKLNPASKEEAEEDLVISAPGLSVWRKWAFNKSGDFKCYFTVIRDTQPGTFEKKLGGVNAILFPISETLAWDIQKAQLHNLVNSLPAGACIPLLITSGSGEANFDQFSSSIVDNLGLNNLDKSRISTFTVVCLNEEDRGQFNGYFSDQKLKDGLTWLASELRSQPAPLCVTVRELVSFHLNSCLDALDSMGDKVGPCQCISAFNQALEQSINDIVTATNTNPTGWPCPELFLLDDSTAEYRAVKNSLPTLGWSSPEEVEPLISALRSCKLPSFPDDISWLNRGCNSEKDIDDKKQLLQNCLIRYLSQSSSILNLMMATKDACVMVQKYTRLELHDTGFKMVPSWVLIFRRVFNWQLNTSASFSCKAYVLEESFTVHTSLILEKSDFEVPESRYVSHPSLDEMVEVSCSPISKRVKSSPKSIQKVAPIASGENTFQVTTPNLQVEERNQCSEIQLVDNTDFYSRKNDMPLVLEHETKADRLTQLLDQCSILQDNIDKKLSFYF